MGKDLKVDKVNKDVERININKLELKVQMSVLEFHSTILDKSLKVDKSKCRCVWRRLNLSCPFLFNYRQIYGRAPWLSLRGCYNRRHQCLSLVKINIRVVRSHHVLCWNSTLEMLDLHVLSWWSYLYIDWEKNLLHFAHVIL